jgi:hypothetical protein
MSVDLHYRMWNEDPPDYNTCWRPRSRVPRRCFYSVQKVLGLGFMGGYDKKGFFRILRVESMSKDALFRGYQRGIRFLGEWLG